MDNTANMDGLWWKILRIWMVYDENSHENLDDSEQTSISGNPQMGTWRAYDVRMIWENGQILSSQEAYADWVPKIEDGQDHPKKQRETMMIDGCQ